MRALHLVWAPRLSGAEVLVKDLALHQKTEGHSVCVASLLPEQADFSPLREELERKDVPCRFPDRAQSLIGKLWRLQHVIRHFKPDVIFAHATIPAFYVRALPIAVPIVYVMHSATNDFARALFRWVERLLSRRASAVIGVSPANVENYHAAIGTHPLLTVIPNGVDTARFTGKDDGNDVRRLPRIAQIGRYTAVKDQMQTLRAFKEVVECLPDARLVLCGVVEDRAYHAGVVDLAAELGIADRVSVEGPRSDVPVLLAESQVYAMPSRSEGHSIAFLEALASGIPVVASTIVPFAFARNLPCVQLVDTNDTHAYANALIAALRQPRTARNLTGLTLADTADQYLSIAQRVVRA
ncbi:glycosyltransferase family 4 protein [Trinickia dinghuensis]|uniref:Glycosyltransferase family 1 protein n=1 Tax=Trinickia dinghuensis TaxID=2291023 RepID=A0A3D8K353_9BURK|nr:glycosyltransferase family 4 protein [Trinickia dinghuensis]RDU99600.1 glycosyltransferase family 1 protein [Trinickia dinghuensis]